MKTLTKLYLATMLSSSICLSNATEHKLSELGDIEYTQKRMNTDIADLRESVMSDKMETTERLINLYVISQKHLKDERDFVNKYTSVLENHINKANFYEIGYMVRIYANLQDKQQTHKYFELWFKDWVGPSGHGPGNPDNPNDALEGLQHHGLKINKLTDLLNLDPIKVLDITDKEFVG